jgi:hypothetical protein
MPDLSEASTLTAVHITTSSTVTVAVADMWRKNGLTAGTAEV